MEKNKSFLKENWLLIVALIYLLFPIDLIPDVLPVIGKLDDTLILLIDLISRYSNHKKTLKRVDDKTFAEDE